MAENFGFLEIVREMFSSLRGSPLRRKRAIAHARAI
jgi:hypothetical protein